MKRLFKLILLINAITLVMALPVEARADPITTALIIGFALTAAASAGLSYGLQALANAVRRKPGATPGAQLEITTSREGEGIPRIYGTFGVGVKIIQRGNITPRQSGGTGKRRGPANTAYSCDLAMVVCENIEDTILGVSRIWLDGELVKSYNVFALDGTNPTVEGIENGDRRKDLLYGRRMQILLGQSTQTALERDWFSLFGETPDTVPAYRGVVTIWVNDMDFEPLFNRIPQIQVEVVQGVGGSAPYPTLYECHLAGLADAQINIASNPPFGLGVAIGANGPEAYKNHLELCPTICVAEVDGKLKFMAIPAASSATIADGELGAIGTGREDVSTQPVKFLMSSEQSATIPARIEVTYLDPDDKYQQASTGYTRQYGVAQGVTHLQVPISHTEASAKQLASQFIARAWTERDTLPKLSLLPKYMKYHPGDVLTITAPDGSLIDGRILTMDFKPGTHPCEITAVRQLRGQGAGNPDDMIPDVPDPTDEVEALYSVSVLSNVPPLIDDHDTFDGIYWAAGPIEVSTSTPPAEWQGAFLFRNACGNDDTNKVYEAVAHTRTAAVIGKARTALANGSGVDTVNTCDVDLKYGDGTNVIVGVHDDAFTKTTTANLAILGKEVIQFRDVEDVSATYSVPAGRVWRLKGKIKRGVRDTAAFTNTHAIDEAFVLYSEESVIRVARNLDESTVEFNWKTLSSGQEETQVDEVAFAYEEGGDTLLKDTQP